ncbi:MAG: hypothetical protein ACU0BS_03405 [Hasllibacter sp.]
MAERPNPEIEDVLASIRRLVSEDVGGGGPRKRAGARLTAPGGPDALVLTPDFRVGERGTAPADEAGAPKGIDPDRPYDLSTIEETIQDLEAAIDAGEDAVGTPWEADGSEEDAWTAPPPEAETKAEAGATPEAEPVPEPPAAPPAEEGTRPDDAAPDEAAAAPAGRIDPDAEEAEVIADGAAGGPAAAGDAGEEAVIDEDTLRAIVADVLREELQGALGERITRNVRKLVRREINQALAAREFD